MLKCGNFKVKQHLKFTDLGQFAFNSNHFWVMIEWKFSKEVVLAVLYKVYLVNWVISLVDTVQDS